MHCGLMVGTQKRWVIMLALIVADCDAADENSPDSIRERPDSRRNLI